MSKETIESAEKAAKTAETVSTVANFIPGGLGAPVSVAAEGISASIAPGVNAGKAAQSWGRDNLDEDFNKDYVAADGYDPVKATKEGWWKKSFHKFGKAALLIAVGLAVMVGFAGGGIVGGLIAAAVSIPVTMIAGYAFDKFSPEPKEQDPVTIGAKLKDMRADGKAVPEVMVGGMMLASLPPESQLRKDVEQRLKSMKEDEQIQVVLEKNPSAVALLLQDPKVIEELTAEYSAVPDPQFLSTVTRLFNSGKIGARDLMHPAACTVANTCIYEQAIQQQQMQQVVRPNVPMTPNMHTAPMLGA